MFSKENLIQDIDNIKTRSDHKRDPHLLTYSIFESAQVFVLAYSQCAKINSPKKREELRAHTDDVKKDEKKEYKRSEKRMRKRKRVVSMSRSVGKKAICIGTIKQTALYRRKCKISKLLCYDG